MWQKLILFIILFMVWLGLSGKIFDHGHLDYIHLGFGVLSVLIVMWLSAPLFKKSIIVGKTRLNWFQCLSFPLWLLIEIIKANIDVAWILLQPTIQLEPRLIKVPFKSDSPLATTVLANSITITPGTYTLEATPEYLMVHALDKSFISAFKQGAMQNKIAALFGFNDFIKEVHAIEIFESIESNRGGRANDNQ